MKKKTKKKRKSFNQSSYSATRYLFYLLKDKEDIVSTRVATLLLVTEVIRDSKAWVNVSTRVATLLLVTVTFILET